MEGTGIGGILQVSGFCGVWIKVELSERVIRCALRWFGHVECMDEEEMVRRVYNFNFTVNGLKKRGECK